MFQSFVTQQKSTIPNLTILETPRSFISFGSVYSIRGLKAPVAPSWLLQAVVKNNKHKRSQFTPLMSRIPLSIIILALYFWLNMKLSHFGRHQQSKYPQRIS
jgi:hypothetical protein